MEKPPYEAEITSFSSFTFRDINFHLPSMVNGQEGGEGVKWE